MNFVEHFYNSADEIIGDPVISTIRNMISVLDFQITDRSFPELKDRIELLFIQQGWSGKYRISNQVGLSVTSVYKDVALCVQFGNISRYAYDVIKIDAMVKMSQVKAGVLMIPTKAAVKHNQIGNIACYERITKELNEVFYATIECPLWVIGIE